MKKSILIQIIIFTIASVISAQSIKVEITGSKIEKAYLSSVHGEKTTLLDSAKNINGNNINFVMKNDVRPGLYRISFLKNRLVDFIFDGKDVSLKSSMNNLLDSMTVLNSDCNKLFYYFIKLNKSYKSKSELLQLILVRYPKDDPFYNQAVKRLNELQSDYTEFVNVTSQIEPSSFIAKYIRSLQLPIVDSAIPADKQLNYLKAHALDYVDFSNSALINSDLFTNKAIEYLTYFRNPQFPKELLEKEFCSAIDSILNKAKVNNIVYQHVVEYLIDGFKQFGFDFVLDYIVNNYVIKDDLCLDVKTEGMIKRRIDQAKFLKIGTKAPGLILPDLKGKEINLNKISNDKTLIVFYLTQCPHCKDLMPKLNDLSQKKKITVLAICLDTKKEDWEKFAKESSPSLINLCDEKGWDGKAADDYFIYAAPSMFLLDKSNKIVGKPITLEELNKLLQ